MTSCCFQRLSTNSFIGGRQETMQPPHGNPLLNCVQMFPKVPVGAPEGAVDENSSYLHLLVCYLEYRAMRELLGELKSRQLMEFWATDHYTWIYKTVLEKPRAIDTILVKHRLLPDPQR